MTAKAIQEVYRCPRCDRQLTNRIFITPLKNGYNVEYVKDCFMHGTVRSSMRKEGLR